MGKDILDSGNRECKGSKMGRSLGGLRNKVNVAKYNGTDRKRVEQRPRRLKG